MAKKKTGERKGRIPPPKCKAILLCQYAIVEAVTGRISIIGLINGFMVPRFPAATQPMYAYLQLVDGIGRYEIVVELQDIATNKVFARAAGPGVVFPEDRLATVQIVIPIPPLPILHAGSYDVVVYANGAEIDRQKFIVRQPPTPGQRGASQNAPEPPGGPEGN